MAVCVFGQGLHQILHASHGFPLMCPDLLACRPAAHFDDESHCSTALLLHVDHCMNKYTRVTMYQAASMVLV